MANELQGRRIAMFLAPQGTEQVEFVKPKEAVEAAGAHVDVFGTEAGSARTVNHDLDPGDTFSVDKSFSELSADEYDGLIVPGGSVGADRLRSNGDAVACVRAFVERGTPVAVICHGPWILVEADAVRGKRLTSFPSLQTDIRNAGGQWVDEEVVVDQGLITSRRPDDLPAFCSALVREFAAGRQSARAGG